MKNKKSPSKGGRMRWLWIWLIQIAVEMLVSLAASASLLLNAALYHVLMWALLPIIGCATAYRATTAGLLNYAAWIAPPAAMVAANVLLWGYSPGPGNVCLCAFVSLVGAAAGEVVKRGRE